MVTAVLEMEFTEENEETPTIALLRACRSSETLAHHPDIMAALVGKNVEMILKHLRQQRDWFSNLSADARDRLDHRKSQIIKHARAACATLNNYEQLNRAA